jgi:Family of unknown function (DUF6152)
MRFKLPVVIAVLAAVPIWAHHGSAGFDQKKPVHFIGKVSLVEWMNPHIVIHVEVAGADGNVATWLVNTLPPNTALRRGFSKNSFDVGTEISVEGFQALDGSNHVNGTNIQLQDGQKVVTPDCFDNGPHCFKPADGKGNRIQ